MGTGYATRLMMPYDRSLQARQSLPRRAQMNLDLR